MPNRNPHKARPRYSARIKALNLRGRAFFSGTSHDSIKAIASRIGAALGRVYQTKKSAKGISVRRIQ